MKTEFVIYDSPNSSVRELEAKAMTLFPKLKGSIRVLRTMAELKELPQTDMALATLWSGAFPLLLHPRATVLGYFVQDFEPLFYPAGTYYGLTEQTYRFNFYGIFNTKGLHDYVTQHYPMLQRNLVYTGVTRGKRLVVLVGQRKALAIAVKGARARRRWAKLREWLTI